MTRLMMSRAGRARRARTLDRIDLNQDRIVRCAVADQRRDGRIARIPAVPIGLAVDLDGLEQRRQAGGGEQHFRRQVGIAENVPAPGVHIGGGDEQLHLRFGDTIEVDAVGKDVAQRIGAMRIEIVGREDARHQIEGDEHRRSVERPAAEHHVERRAAEGAEQCRVGNAPPELLERGLGTLGAARSLAADQDGCVHGAGRGSGNALDLESRLLQKAIEDPPGKGTVRATALERQVHRGAARRRLSPWCSWRTP